MPAPDCRQWIDELWPLVCRRAMRPLGGILLEAGRAGEIAEEVFDEFLGQFPRRPGSWESVQHWLTARVRPLALLTVAEERRSRGNWQAFRDPVRAGWERNPDFDDLRRRSADGALISREWDLAAPVLTKVSVPVFLRLGIGDEDAADIRMETMAELTRAAKTPGALEKLLVFEELPRLFSTMIERRAISWLRKASAIKRRPVNPAFTDRLDDPDNSSGRLLADPRAGTPDACPWESAGFDRIRRACRRALTDFEWHLVEVLFVDASHTRQDLVDDPWILEQLGVEAADSESKRRRRLNLFLDEALARLGRALTESDL